LQNYTNREENAYIKNGSLFIEARHEDYSDGKNSNQFTSAKLDSRASWTYGRLEIRARVPIVRGAWPAGWLFPEKQSYGDSFWPDNGEIDVLESVGHIPGVNVASAHSKAFNFKSAVMRNKSKEVSNLNTKFHTYAVEWLPTHMDFYVDDDRYFSVYKEATDTWKQWPFDQDFHLKLNMAVGGDWAGEAGIDDQAFPAKLEIDYVRVYRPTSVEDCNDGRLPAGKFTKVIRAIGHPEKKP
jgi:licheninase